MPRTLFGRLFALLLLLILLGQLSTWLVLEWHRVRVLSAQVAEQTLDRLAEAEAELYKASDDVAPNSFDLDNQPYQIHLRPGAIEPPAAEPPSLLARAIAAELSKELGQHTPILYTENPTRQLWRQVHLGGEAYWLIIPLGRFHGPPLKPLIVGSAIFIVLAAAGAALFVWRLNRPLRRLVAAREELGKNKRTDPVPEQGPVEIKHLAQTFNRMQRDLRIHEQERELWLAGVSHDLRTPLTRLDLALALLPDDAEHRAMHDDLEEMKRTLQQFLDFARAGRDEAAAEVDINECLRRQVKPLAAEGVDIRIERHGAARTSLRVTAFGRILSNLLENARRYGAAPIEIGVDVAQDGGLRLRVRDHGPGIAEADREDLLQPFRRGERARTADGGCGLGLAIVDRLVRQQGGRWSLKNADGGGLEVEVELPAA